jgi:uncharacterized protein with ParB-like and HNH nuclease domain
MSSIQNVFLRNQVSNLLDVVNQPGLGFLIPSYQRPYKWTGENIERLIDDILSELNRSQYGNDVDILFLGTLIVARVGNDEWARYNTSAYVSPMGIYHVVDGQQRLSTLAMLAINLHFCVKMLIDKLRVKYSNVNDFNNLEQVIDDYILENLAEFYSVRFAGSATPSRKPLILRMNDEFWQRTGSDLYKSPIARYIADYINEEKVVDYSKHSYGASFNIVQQNQKAINELITNKLLKTGALSGSMQISENQKLVNLTKILFPQTYHSDLALIMDINQLNNEIDFVHLLKLSLFSLYMSRNCCVNYLEPRTQEWAIEVFQSLNSTGMPLSSLEVFKAFVYQHTNTINMYTKTLDVDDVFDGIEQLLAESKDPASLTNTYLTALALGFDGHKLGTRNTDQKKYLESKFNTYLENKRTNNSTEYPLFKYMEHLTDYMSFRSNLGHFMNHEQESLALLFLEAMGLNTIHPMLAYFYKERKPGDRNFLEACLATAAFYAMWRSVKSSSELDNVARELMSSGVDVGMMNVVMKYENNNQTVSITDYKNALKQILIRENMWDKSQWVGNAQSFLTYQNSTTLCRFILFLTAHDTIPDNEFIGGIQKGAKDTHSFLSGKKWRKNQNSGTDWYSTVEHIAPQNPNQNDKSWDTDIYGDESKPGIFHSIGNLTLLPKSMNSILSNLSWGYKHQFYSHLANPSEVKRQQLLKIPDIKYTKKAEEVLKNTAMYFHYLEPIVRVPASDGAWSRAIVEKRTEQICSLAYDRLSKWLEE